jgi:hypothetical protein
MRDGAYWHGCEVPTASGNAQVREQSGRRLLSPRLTQSLVKKPI